MAVTRSEWRSFGAGHVACGSVCFSTDRGRSWSSPQMFYHCGGPTLEALPDGGLVFCAQGIKKLVFSYDGEFSWSREMTGPINTYTGVVAVDGDHLFVYGKWDGRQACVYRRVPAGAK